MDLFNPGIKSNGLFELLPITFGSVFFECLKLLSKMPPVAGHWRVAFPAYRETSEALLSPAVNLQSKAVQILAFGTDENAMFVTLSDFSNI
jgi:hypothetical protein